MFNFYISGYTQYIEQEIMVSTTSNGQDILGSITYTPNDLGWAKCTEGIKIKQEKTIRTLELLLALKLDSSIFIDRDTGIFYFSYSPRSGFPVSQVNIVGGKRLSDSVVIWEKECRV